MSFEAITVVTKAEADAKAAISGAEASARQAVADAENAGRKAVEAAAAKANSELVEEKRIAETKAMSQADELVKATDERKAELRAKAQEKLEEAVAFVVERIVNS